MIYMAQEKQTSMGNKLYMYVYMYMYICICIYVYKCQYQACGGKSSGSSCFVDNCKYVIRNLETAYEYVRQIFAFFPSKSMCDTFVRCT